MTGRGSDPEPLVQVLLTGLLREDVGGLRSGGVLYRRSGGCRRWRPGHLVLAFGALRLPVRRGDPALGDLLADLVVTRPWLEVRGLRRSVRVRALPAVLNALRRAMSGDDDLADGWLALRAEALAAERSVGLRRRAEAGVRGRLRSEAAAIEPYETLAAYDDHPLHPLSAARVGLSASGVTRFAPEHRRDVVPRWLRVPAEMAEVHGELPPWWPAFEGAVTIPVHPATGPELLPQHAEPVAVADLADLADLAVTGLVGLPTLSMRTLALTGHPGTYLKLPMAVRTLGRLNLRQLSRAGLADGVLVQRLLGAVLARDPEWAGRVAVADESTWVWGGSPMLAAMVRRIVPVDGVAPTEGVTAPVAALAARGLSGRPVAVELADQFWGGDLTGMLGDYLDALLGWHLTLWLRHGIALEAHPQNVCLRVHEAGGRPRVDLLMRDLDSARLDLARIAASLPEIAPGPEDLGDPRLAARTSGELAQLVLTSTLHQCVAAVLMRVARRTRQPVQPWLALVPERLLRWGRPEVEHLLTAARLPVKCSMTAATLLPKHRTGPGDVNKYYAADAPSYLPASAAVPGPRTGPDPGEVTSAALISCLVREVAIPHGQASLLHGVLRIDLDGSHRLEVAATGGTPGTARPHGPVTLTTGPDQASAPLGWAGLADLVERRLRRDDGAGGSDLAGQVRASHDLIASAVARRPHDDLPHRDRPHRDGYLASEQSLLAGHRHHPAPKARSGQLGEALEFAPEVRSAFVLHHLAVAEGAAWQRQASGGEAGLLDKLVADDVQVPPGYLALPVHPWQLRMLRRDQETAAVLDHGLTTGRLLDLGPGRVRWTPTASVRTLVRPGAAGFLKVGLSVRITNCIRINPRHEIEAAVRLSDHLAPVVAELRSSSPGLEVLLEPAGRSIDDPHLADPLGVLVRSGLPAVLPDGGPARPVLAAALVEPVPDPGVAAVLARIVRDPGRTLDWWLGYLGHLLPPVLRALLVHGVVFEAHLQNVVLLLDRDDQVGGLVLRDLEGAKLLSGKGFPQRNGLLSARLPAAVRDHLGYAPQQGWNRVAYCLLVNHVATLLGALADLTPRPSAGDLENRMWTAVTDRLAAIREQLGDLPGEPLAAVLRGGPVPAKANLLTRWHDLADRDSGYVPVHLPLGPS